MIPMTTNAPETTKSVAKRSLFLKEYNDWMRDVIDLGALERIFSIQWYSHNLL